MFVLDSDHMSLLEWGGADSAALHQRLADVPDEDLATTIVCYEEQMRGWMAYIGRARSIAQQVDGYRRLRTHLDNLPTDPCLGF
jgi:tRNA(fMet)-specific endonuclease VapC